MKTTSHSGLMPRLNSINCLRKSAALNALITFTTFAASIAFTALIAAGCKREKGNGENNNNNQSQCPEGYRAEGPACVPIFDNPEDCPGPNEMPKLGGGCRPVGVLECADGFVKDSDGGCEPILPDHECPPGTMEVIGETECRPVGVIQCAEGFVSDGQGGCDAILPPGPDPCPPGTIEQIGHDTCQPLGDCGPDPSEGGSPWGNIQVDENTIFVDEGSDADEPDGTQDAPYRTVTEALQAAEPGGQVAIAAGEYEERLILSKPVRLTGRCSERVTLRGVVRLGNPEPALRIGSGGSGSEVRGVTLTGPGEGMRVDGAVDVLVEEVEVRDTEGWGIDMLNQSELVLLRVKVINCSTIGIYSENSMTSIGESVVQGTLPQIGTGFWGQGIQAKCSIGGACGYLKVEGSLIHGNRDIGIAALGVETSVISSVVRDTLPEESDGVFGVGINAECRVEAGECGKLTVEGSLIHGNREHAIFSAGVETSVISSVVRDVLQRESDGEFGRGIAAQCDVEVGECGMLTVERSLIHGNRDVGIVAAGVATTVISSVVRDTLPQESDGKGGIGIAAHCDVEASECGTLTLEGSLIHGNREVGISAIGVETSVISSVVRDTLPQKSDGEFGRGINAQCHVEASECGTLTLKGSLIHGNREVGISAIGVETSVISSVVRDTLPQESDGRFGRGINAQCDDETGECGSLLVLDTLVAFNENVGIFISGTPADLRGVVVIDTVTNEAGSWQGEYGQGISAMCFKHLDIDECGFLAIDSSMVVSSHAAGVAVQGVSGIMTGSMVDKVFAQPKDGKYGYGVQIAGWEGADIGGFPFFHVRDSVIRDAKLAGVFYRSSEGVLSGTVVSGGEYSVAINICASPSIGEDNLLSGTVEDEPQWVNLEPSPMPMPAMPME